MHDLKEKRRIQNRKQKIQMKFDCENNNQQSNTTPLFRTQQTK